MNRPHRPAPALVLRATMIAFRTDPAAAAALLGAAAFLFLFALVTP